MYNLVDLQTLDPLLNHCRIFSEVYTMKMWFFITGDMTVNKMVSCFLFQVNEKNVS